MPLVAPAPDHCSVYAFPHWFTQATLAALKADPLLNGISLELLSNEFAARDRVSVGVVSKGARVADGRHLNPSGEMIWDSWDAEIWVAVETSRKHSNNMGAGDIIPLHEKICAKVRYLFSEGLTEIDNRVGAWYQVQDVLPGGDDLMPPKDATGLQYDRRIMRFSFFFNILDQAWPTTSVVS